MSIQIKSTSDSNEAVTAALGDLAELIPSGDKSATAEEAVETPEDSEPTDDTENESDESESKDESEPKEKSKRKSGFKRRIDKLNGKLSAVEQDREYWRAQALKNQGSEQPKQTIAPNTEGKPNKDDFESHEDYVEALTDWKVDNKLQARDAKDRETRVKTEYQKLANTYISRRDAFRESHPDFDEKMDDIDDIAISLTVREVLLSSENGPELAYELAKNRKEYERICALPAIAAARELGRFEMRLAKSDTSEKTQTKAAKAPSPIKPVKSNSTGTGKKSIDDPDLTQREYEQLREQEIARRA